MRSRGAEKLYIVRSSLLFFLFNVRAFECQTQLRMSKKTNEPDVSKSHVTTPPTPSYPNSLVINRVRNDIKMQTGAMLCTTAGVPC